MARTLINIRDDLLERAGKLSGLKKKVQIVNHALEVMVRQAEIEKVLRLGGKVRWEGSLEEMRRNRVGSRR